jgi:hypothetical protein
MCLYYLIIFVGFEKKKIENEIKKKIRKTKIQKDESLVCG